MNNIPTLSWANMPSPMKGAARVVDLFGKLDEYKTSSKADLELLKSDWELVGKDISMSMQTYEQEESQSILAETNAQ